MSGTTMVILSAFVAYLLLMIVIGVVYMKKTSSSEDYFLGGRGLNAWVAALSAQASDMSGWLLMGLPGAIYSLDTGTHESLVEATNFVKTMESHQHRKIGCLEEIAYLNGWITKEDVLKVYEILKKNQYGQYLKDVLDGKYLDVLH